MNSEDVLHVGENCPHWPGSSHAELSQSTGTGSDALSLPSGNRLADISLSSDIADSEIENEDTVLTSAPHKSLSVVTSDMHNDTWSVPIQYAEDKQQEEGGTGRHEYKFDTRSSSNISGCNVKSVSASNNVLFNRSNFQETEWRKPLSLSYSSHLSLGDVKVALQENCNLLTDQHLLDDLLKSLDKKIQEDSSFNSSHSTQVHQSYKIPVVEPNRDPGLNLSRQRVTHQVSVDGREAMSGAPHQNTTCKLPTLSNAHPETQNMPSSLGTKSLSDEGHDHTHKDRGDPTLPRASDASKEKLEVNLDSEKHVKFDDSAKEMFPLPSESEARDLHAEDSSKLNHSIIK